METDGCTWLLHGCPKWLGTNGFTAAGRMISPATACNQITSSACVETVSPAMGAIMGLGIATIGWAYCMFRRGR